MSAQVDQNSFLSHRVQSWAEICREQGDDPLEILAAYEEVRTLWQQWMKGCSWHDRTTPDHPDQEKHWPTTVQRGRDFAAAADALAEWVGCSSRDLCELLECESSEEAERQRVREREAQIVAMKHAQELAVLQGAV